MRPSVVIALLLLIAILNHPSYANSSDDIIVVDGDVTHEQSNNQPAEAQPLHGEVIHPNPPKAVNEDPAINQLITWLTSNGADRSGVEVVDTMRRGRGLVASEDLPANHTIISCPFNLLLTSQWIMSNSSISHLLPSNTHPTDAFAIYLAANRADNQSVSRTFIDSLPEFVPLPLFYSDHLLSALKNTTLEATAAARRSVAYKSYARLDNAIKQRVSKGDYFWGLSIVWSRSFGVAKRDQPTSPWKSVPALVPLVDFLNTGDEHEINVKCRTAQQGKTFTCVTTQAVQRSDELLVSYGRRSNSQLLHDYGFATFTPVNDIALFKLPAPKAYRDKSDDSNVLHRKSDVQDALTRAGKFDRSSVFTLNAPAILNVSSFEPNQTLSVVIPSDTFGWARLCVIDKEDMNELEAHEMIERIDSGEVFSANNDLRAIRLINQSIHEALSYFPQTIEEDLEALNGGELVQTNAALFWITLMRFFEKSILADVSALFDEKMPELMLEAVKETAARQSAVERKKQELEEKRAREQARKAEKDRLRRDESHEIEDDEADDDDDDEDEEEESSDNVQPEVAGAAAWRRRDEL